MTSSVRIPGDGVYWSPHPGRGARDRRLAFDVDLGRRDAWPPAPLLDVTSIMCQQTRHSRSPHSAHVCHVMRISAHGPAPVSRPGVGQIAMRRAGASSSCFSFSAGPASFLAFGFYVLGDSNRSDPHTTHEPPYARRSRDQPEPQKTFQDLEARRRRRDETFEAQGLRLLLRKTVTSHAATNGTKRPIRARVYRLRLSVDDDVVRQSERHASWQRRKLGTPSAGFSDLPGRAARPRDGRGHGCAAPRTRKRWA